MWKNSPKILSKIAIWILVGRSANFALWWLGNFRSFCFFKFHHILKKLRDSGLGQIFEDGTKLKIPSEIILPLPSALLTSLVEQTVSLASRIVVSNHFFSFEKGMFPPMAFISWHMNGYWSIYIQIKNAPYRPHSKPCG